MYYRARWFDSQQGKFISQDPIGFRGGDINLYGYVWRNPLNYRDPLGLDGWGNDTADWLDERIEYARQYWQHNDQEWLANGMNNSVADFAHGFADLFRVGSGLGQAMFATDENGYGRAAFLLHDIGRAAAIFSLLTSPVARATSTRPCECINRWPSGPEKMDDFLGMKGNRIPDTAKTLGRGKVQWEHSDKIKITFEQHPYHPNAPSLHRGPHWHLDTPACKHARYVPGDPMP